LETKLRKCQILIFNKTLQRVRGNEKTLRHPSVYLQNFLQSLYISYPHVIPYKFPLKPPCRIIRRNNEFDSSCYSQGEISASIFRRLFAGLYSWYLAHTTAYTEGLFGPQFDRLLFSLWEPAGSFLQPL
jgi:hypothetical protein